MRRSRRPDSIDPDAITGPVRLDRATAKLTHRLQPGDIAVVDHVDLDAASAGALVACGVAAVVNASPSTSGRYPNLGPAVLIEAGIPLLDAVGVGVFDDVREGNVARLTNNELWVGDRRVVTGVLLDRAAVAAAAEQARARLAAQVTDLTANATGFLLDERDLLLEGVGIPTISTDLADRPAVVVTRGYGDIEQLAVLRGWVRRQRRTHRPVLVGVEGVADLLLDAGLRPDVVVGDLDNLSDAAVKRAGEVVIRAGTDGRLSDVPVVRFATSVASEDMALLLVQHAALIVTVGFPNTLEELLDRGRVGASSSLLTRIGLGDRIVGARAVAGLTRSSPRGRRFAVPLVVLGAAAAVGVAFAGSRGFDLHLLTARWDELVASWPW